MKKHLLFNMMLMLLFTVICYASNTPGYSNTFNKLRPAPVVRWSAGQVNLLIQKGSTTTQKFTLTASNSSNASVKYTISAAYTGASGWLAFSTTVTATKPVITFTYTKGATLAIGTYTATITLKATGYTSATANVQLRVIDAKQPYVISSTPANGATNVDVSAVSVAANMLHIPVVTGVKGGVDNTTIIASTVQLYKVVGSTSTLVQGVVQGTGGGDVISFSPSKLLSANTTYKFVITNGVKTYAKAAFIPFSATFKTGNAPPPPPPLHAQFTKVLMPVTQHKKYTNLKFGPDGKLYALMLDGTIERYSVDRSGTATDGTLINLQTIKTLTNVYGTRSAIGLVFDPAATAGNLICYVSHSKVGLVNSPDFDGKISKLMGANLETEQLIITELPRSTRDHMTNSLAFGPDNALYICQGSNSSAGAYDNDWKRAEALLSGTILRLDFDKLNGIALPLDVKTTSTQSVINAAPSNSRFMSDGTYNPYSSVSPLTIYASGVRNAFSMLWHSNGQLYLPTNGSGGGGNSPASVSGTLRPDGSVYSGPTVPATTNIGVQTDWLFRVNPLKNVGYFGHPNPLRGEYVENRGSLDNPLYPANTGPDSRYRGAAFNFGLNHSPNGVIEYKSHSFHDSLLNKLIVCRFSGGGDLIVLKPGSLVKDPSITATSDDKIYDIVQANAGIEDPSMVRMSHFTNPLNLVEDIVNGNIFVIEYNWNNLAGMTSQITLLRVVNSPSGTSRPSMAVSVNNAQDIQGLANFKSYDVKLSNNGEGVLRIKDVSITGTGASNFKISGINLPQENDPLIINGKASQSFTVIAPNYDAAKGTNTLRITSIDDSVKDIPLVLSPEVGNAALDSAKIGYTRLTNAPPTMLLYPNPDRGEQLNVALKGFEANKDVTIYLYNIMGSQLKSVKVKSSPDGVVETALALPPHAANTSMYIVRAVSGSILKEGKVAVQ